ncbi:MAG: IS4 family transposase [Kiritimatiellae bacterium]|nr:IS4 family transposase [Kiritimatiellia bacterium]
MSSKKPKATRRRMISCFAQIVQEHLPGWKIEELAAGEKIKARKFSYSSQVYLLMLSQFLHLFSLNEIVDVSRIYAPELSRIRGISPASLNMFSNANRTRSAGVMQAFFWAVYGFFRNEEPDFVRGRHHGRLSRFKLRGIYAMDSTTIQLAYWCIDWAKHRQRKAAVKVHMVANVANRLPHFCVFGKAKDHDSKMEDELFNSLKEGDIGIADRAYNSFKALYRQSRRGVFFVVREKSGMRYRVVKRVAKKDLGENILSDETIQLTGQRTSKEYPDAMRRVKARVKVDGKWRTMVFLTNNFEWSASTIAELYKARWEVELLFKELKQTLQLQDFYGENANAVEWQIWAALLTHLVLRWRKYKSGAACSYSRFAALARAIVWLKKDAMAILRSYGIAPPPDSGGAASGMPYLPGFEKMFLKAVG